MMALLIRHADTTAIGQVLWGRKPGLPLSAAGMEQAGRLATRLARVPLAVAHRLPIVEADALDEVDFGDWSGLRFEELDQRPDWRAFNADRASAHAPNGERLAGVQSRIVSRLGQLASQHGDDTVALISHADVIRSAILHYLGMPLDAFGRIEVSPASITAMALQDGSATFLSINEPDRH